MSFASICVLSYERPEFLRACLSSLADAGAPYELIVHDDGSFNPDVHRVIDRFFDEGMISHLLLNPPGHNEGVGEAVRKCFAVAQGDLLIKVDQDLMFGSHEITPGGWLAKVREIFADDGRIGALGLFAYHHDPVDVAKTRLDEETGADAFYVTDFVGSAFAVPRSVYEHYGPIPTHSAAFAEDIDLKNRIRLGGSMLALPHDDLCVNVGFGLGPSTVVVAEDTVRAIHHGPIVLAGTLQEASAYRLPGVSVRRD